MSDVKSCLAVRGLSIIVTHLLMKTVTYGHMSIRIDEIYIQLEFFLAAKGLMQAP